MVRCGLLAAQPSSQSLQHPLLELVHPPEITDRALQAEKTFRTADFIEISWSDSALYIMFV